MAVDLGSCGTAKMARHGALISVYLCSPSRMAVATLTRVGGGGVAFVVGGSITSSNFNCFCKSFSSPGRLGGNWGQPDLRHFLFSSDGISEGRLRSVSNSRVTPGKPSSHRPRGFSH